MTRHIFMVSLLLLTASALAQTPPSLEQLRVAAVQGDVEAQYELGILYEFGFQYPDHRMNAFVWYSRAAEHGHPEAVKRLEALKPQLKPTDIERAQKELASAPKADASVPSAAAQSPAPTTP